jgi:hypothetical protein
MENAFKLFVVGEHSRNPEDWSAWSELSLVIATTAEEAVKLSGGWNGPATEIPLDSAKLLVTMPEPHHGVDI